MSRVDIGKDISSFDSELSELSGMDRIMVQLFIDKYNLGSDEMSFTLDDVRAVASEKSISLRNPADFIYQYRARRALPEQILKLGNWILTGVGKGKYLLKKIDYSPHFEYEIPDDIVVIKNTTPERVKPFLRNDEMSSLTKLRYCETISHFTSLTCSEIQTHYRSFVKGVGQVEIDEFYVGESEKGRWLIPLEAKSNVDTDRLGRVQISQMVSAMKQDFPNEKRRILALKDIGNDEYLIFELTNSTDPSQIEIEKIVRYKIE